MEKTIDLTRPVAETVSEYPEVKEILYSIGFKNITKPAALATVGKLVTPLQGASIMNVPVEEVVSALEKAGFTVTGISGKDTKAEERKESIAADGFSAARAAGTDEKQEQIDALKAYIRRLSQGEDLETVRADFVENFETVDADEIMHAEQQLMEEGMKIADVQRLCDVHSALFHGRTREEQIANAEKAVEEAVRRREMQNNPASIPGHPLHLLLQENEAIEARIHEAENWLETEGKDLQTAGRERYKQLIESLRSVSSHYAKKGDLLYPLLNRTYGITGPSNVMWGVDDEIRDELSDLARSGIDAESRKRLAAVLKRMEEMLYKENNILYPLCLRKFSPEDWMHIYYEMPSYASLVPGEDAVWKEAEENREKLKIVGGKGAGNAENYETALAENLHHQKKEQGGMVILGSGYMTDQEIYSAFNTIPMELTFVDEKNINRFFNEGEKVFKRPATAIGRDVFACHPPKFETMVRGIIESFRSGEKDSVEVWMEKNDQPFLVRYLAVRDEKGKYLGVLECVQNMQFAKEHFLGEGKPEDSIKNWQNETGTE